MNFQLGCKSLTSPRSPTFDHFGKLTRLSFKTLIKLSWRLTDSMTTHHNPHSRLTEAMRLVLRNIERAGRPPMHLLTAQQARLFYEMSASILDLPEPYLARVDDLQIPMRDGHWIKAKLFAPIAKAEGVALPTLVYFHGGGFTIGSIQTHNVLCRELARIAHCAVISVDYRLAPEHRFPTATHDAWDALQWVAKSAHLLGLRTDALAVGGDSAGGTLAAVCAILARDAGLNLALQLLFYPGTAARQETSSHHTYEKGFVLDKATVDWFFDHYIDAKDRDDWRFAPMLAERHDELAPLWMGLAECDPLVDEGVAYADLLRLAGVAVDLEIYQGVVHGFINMGRVIPEARRAHDDAGHALKRAFSQLG